eukprot:COSAG04_NODE_4737_length_1918_cov_1.907642_1_plen_93_part_00
MADGGLKIVPGGATIPCAACLRLHTRRCASGHLHRSARLEPHPSWREGESNHFDDDALAAGWLAGRTHPRTGEPLRIARLSAPPDTMVSVHT